MKLQDLSLSSLLLLLAACGGGHDEAMPTVPPAAPTEIPGSALSSSASYTQFILTQSQGSSETEEPLNADKVDAAPGSETDEPASIG